MQDLLIRSDQIDKTFSLQNQQRSQRQTERSQKRRSSSHTETRQRQTHEHLVYDNRRRTPRSHTNRNTEQIIMYPTSDITWSNESLQNDLDWLHPTATNTIRRR